MFIKLDILSNIWIGHQKIIFIYCFFKNLLLIEDGLKHRSQLFASNIQQFGEEQNILTEILLEPNTKAFSVTAQVP